jgi:MSHA pilin protein MshD
MFINRIAPGTTRQPGFTLVELVVFIVVVAVGISGILSVMTFTSRHSADPMVREQALLVAESYMQEILLKSFLDPSAGTTRVCPVKEATRAAYDNVCDYNGLADTGARDQLGNAIAGLSAYNVSVSVTGNTTVDLNGITNGPAANQVRVLRVDVEVRHSDSPDFSVFLTGYRTNYNCSAATDPACLPL